MQVLIIHNQRDKDRAQNIEAQLSSQTLRIEPIIIPAHMDYGCPPAGILKSFQKTIAYAMDNNLESICILEDDFDCLVPDALERLFKIWENMKDNILLGGIYEGEITQETVFELGNNIGTVKGKLSGLHCMILGKDSYRYIIQAQPPYNLDYSLSQINPGTEVGNIVVAYPFLVQQKDGFYSYNAKIITNYTKGLRYKYKFADDV